MASSCPGRDQPDDRTPPIEGEAWSPGDLPAVALGVGDVPGASSPVPVLRLSNGASASTDGLGEHTVDLVAAVDVQRQGDAVPGPRRAWRQVLGRLSLQQVGRVESEEDAAE